jgi:hypothetical protein
MLIVPDVSNDLLGGISSGTNEVVHEQLVQAGIRFRQWMLDNLAHAASHFRCAVTGPPRHGWMDRSIGAPVEGARWHRVVSEEKQRVG